MKTRLWRIEFDMGNEQIVYYRRCPVEKLDQEIEKLKVDCPGYKCITYQVVDPKLLKVVETWVTNEGVNQMSNKNKKYVIQDRQAGNVIDVFETKEKAEKTLELYELDDRNNGVYEPGFYEIVEIEE